MGFLLSAEFATPANEASEIIVADIKVIIFLIYFPFLNIKKLIIRWIRYIVNYEGMCYAQKP